MLRQQIVPLKTNKSFQTEFPSSMIILNINILYTFFISILDVIKIWDAVSAYIESYMKQSKVILKKRNFIFS